MSGIAAKFHMYDAWSLNIYYTRILRSETYAPTECTLHGTNQIYPVSLSLTSVRDMRINNNNNKQTHNKWSVERAGGSYSHKANIPIVDGFGDVIASQSLTFLHENISKFSIVNKAVWTSTHTYAERLCSLARAARQSALLFIVCSSLRESPYKMYKKIAIHNHIYST